MWISNFVMKYENMFFVLIRLALRWLMHLRSHRGFLWTLSTSKLFLEKVFCLPHLIFLFFVSLSMLVVICESQALWWFVTGFVGESQWWIDKELRCVAFSFFYYPSIYFALASTNSFWKRNKCQLEASVKYLQVHFIAKQVSIIYRSTL